MSRQTRVRNVYSTSGELIEVVDNRDPSAVREMCAAMIREEAEAAIVEKWPPHKQRNALLGSLWESALRDCRKHIKGCLDTMSDRLQELDEAYRGKASKPSRCDAMERV